VRDSAIVIVPYVYRRVCGVRSISGKFSTNDGHALHNLRQTSLVSSNEMLIQYFGDGNAVLTIL
jgi:hypothetical protein